MLSKTAAATPNADALSAAATAYVNAIVLIVAAPVTATFEPPSVV
jgi:hypothetical protein